ncbi:uncharacterized protein LOC119066523 [Bradysia coprophila]|uniref:uncharacterized protein LOC119066523 n=1 Tax=Bradysia coprophila TaxID=38358 RepID=UPI00187D7101|nr:uncharacterized protein LOC119066523 [Bradysia coprophila]
MAASVYATPPPDFSGEDTALSDVSNSSQQSSSNSIHSKTATKRSLTQPTITTSITPLLNTTICVSNGNSSSCGLSSPIDTIPDNSKKRRKQQTPIRISALNFGAGSELPATDDDQQRQPLAGNDDQNLPKIFLSNLSQLQAKLSEIPDQDNNGSPASEQDNDKSSENDERDEVENGEITSRMYRHNNLNCDQCNMKFDSEVKLGLHILQEHGPKSHQIKDSDGNVDRFKVNIKKEPLGGDPEWNNDDDKPQNTNGHSKPEDWLSIPGLPFSFPPEAAAMFSASGYLPQLPLLGVSSTSQYPSADGIHRPSVPPLRIFNPEAYCDLCNKEFCNKYFLKTHKANKHSIYDPIVSSADMPSTSQLTHMSQVFQLQQQQLQSQAQSQSTNQQSQSPQQQQQSQISQGSSSSVSSFSQEPSVFCDICYKRFTNIFAMRRHRNKVHEIPPQNDQKSEGKSSAGASNTCTPYTVPEGFREDFSIEQEDATFTPQPRKLSPSSSQQARDSNFSVDKLKRLGVINPEAFCELCCKEYCNKYFLRTHKIKRHGIFMPADDKDEKQAWQFVQTSPLNLMMGTVEQMNRFQNQRKLEAGEIRKPSFDTVDEVEGKKLKLEDNKKAIDGEVTKDGNKSSDDTPSNPDPDAISVDLQKLQSMILQLNDLNAQRPVGCGLCGKEMDNQYALHAHMMTEHAHIGENNNGTKRSQSSSPVNCRIEICKQCDKEFPNSFALTQHLYEVHGIQQNSPVREGFVTPDRPISEMGLLNVSGQLGDRKAYSITPTSSYCEICNKELCNKYFMKTHMHRMHGIEIENGAQIGGVVCNICNKELCSKYFLRVHKHNTHGIVDEGSPLPQPRQNGDGIRSEPIFPMEVGLKPGEISELSNRYFTHFTEVCPLCNRRFRGSKWLRTHLMSDHGNAGTEKLREIEHTMDLPKSTSPTLKIPNGAFGLNPNESNFMHKNSLTNLFAGEEPVSSTSKTKEYQCTFCSFSTPSYAFLFIHERSHTLLSGPASHHNQSESAVSIAKDQQRIMQPASYGGVTNSNSSETPTSTPATTPVPVPLTPQESALTKQQQHLQQKQDEAQQQNQKHQDEDTKNENQLEQPLNGGNVLTEAANMTQRPATYALPQTSDGITMQSFLMEEMVSTSSSSNEDGVQNRFVPSIVFLPVKERISGKLTVSFSLTPA